MRECVSLDVELPTPKTVLPTEIAIPTPGLVVCLPACLPACFCLSCIFVGRSSQLTQLNESSRFARFGVLRRSPKARGTGSQSLQTSMRPPQSRSTLEHSPTQTLPSDDGGRTVCACASAKPQDLPRAAIWSLCHGNKLNLPGFEMSQASRAVPTSGCLPPPLTREISDGRLVASPPTQNSLVECPGNGRAGEGEGKNSSSRPGREVSSRASSPCYSLQTGTAQDSTLRLTSALKSPPGCEPSLRAQTPVRSAAGQQQCVM